MPGEVEDADLHEGACEFDADDVEAGVVECEADGSAVFLAFQTAGFFDCARFDELCGDLGDGGGGESECFGDLRA